MSKLGVRADRATRAKSAGDAKSAAGASKAKAPRAPSRATTAATLRGQLSALARVILDPSPEAAFEAARIAGEGGLTLADVTAAAVAQLSLARGYVVDDPYATTEDLIEQARRLDAIRPALDLMRQQTAILGQTVKRAPTQGGAAVHVAVVWPAMWAKVGSDTIRTTLVTEEEEAAAREARAARAAES